MNVLKTEFKSKFEEADVPQSEEIILYKGNRIWKAKFIAPDQVEVTTGLVGRNNRSTIKRFKGSSVGRANEKTAKFNALKWMNEAAKNRKDKDGFTETQGATAGSSSSLTAPRPMLAQTLDKDAQMNLPMNIFIQPKFDGVRAIISTKDGRIWSRNGKELPMPHISNMILDMGITEVDWLDGELYAHGLGFQTVVGLVKRSAKRGGMEDKSKHKIGFYMYDCVSSAPFSKRYQIIEKIFNRNIHKPSELVSQKDKKRWFALASTWDINKTEIKFYHDQFVEHDFEGAIVRIDGHGYEAGKRSKYLLKVKEFADSEFKIIGFKQEQGDVRKEPTLGAFILETEDGQQFTARPKMTDAERLDIWKNQGDYLGKVATVKYLELSDRGIPRHPNVLGIRLEQD